MQRRCRLCNPWGINPRFHGLYPGKGQVPYALLTRAPVAISVLLRHAAPRLACVKPVASVHPEPGSNSSWYEFHLFFFLSRRPAARLRVIPDAPRLLLVFLTFQYLKELFLLRLLPRPFLGAKAGAKINTFLIPFQIFRQLFSKFFPKPLCATPEKREPPRPSPSKLSMYSCPLPKAGAKVLLPAISSKFFRHFFHEK